MSQNSKKQSKHVVLYDDLIIEVLSFLNVKSLMKFKCVTKFWKTLISDPTFIKLHLQRSSKTKHMAVNTPNSVVEGFRVATVPLNHLIENPSIIIPIHPHNRLEISGYYSIKIVGSCNGLLCFICHGFLVEPIIWFHIWNPATRIISKQLGSTPSKETKHKFTFAFDDSTRTYKVVVMCRTRVKIFNSGDNSWRTISCFPLYEHDVVILINRLNEGVYLSGNVNWFAIRSKVRYRFWFQCQKAITVDQLVIISLDLGTETYMQLSPPRGVNEVPYVEPTIVVLMDCLCFCHDFKRTHFVIWKMTEFGVEQSWTQLLKISFQNLQVDEFIYPAGKFCQLFPIYLSENGDKLILKNPRINKLILYHLSDNRVEQTTHKLPWLSAQNYVESLASIC